MFQRCVILLVIISVLLMTSVSASQELGCQLDVTSAMGSLAQAQQEIDGGDIDTALHTIGEVRSALQLQEAQCADYAPDSAGNSRTNPVPIGQRQHVEISRDFSGSIELIEYIDNAEDYVHEANNRNDPAPEGTRYIVYRMRYSCDRASDETCEFSRVYFETVGDRGVVYDFGSGSDYDISIRDIGDSEEIFGGTEIEVAVAFLVDADETNFVLMTAKSSKPRVYFASQ